MIGNGVRAPSESREGATDPEKRRGTAAGGEAIVVPCNVSDKAQLQALVDATNKQWGRIDILVCNAAVNPFFGPSKDIPDDAFDKVPMGAAMNKGLTLNMNQCPVKRQWPRLFEHVKNGYLKPSELVTHRIPLEHIGEGYHTFSAKLDGVIKPLVVPSAA